MSCIHFSKSPAPASRRRDAISRGSRAASNLRGTITNGITANRRAEKFAYGSASDAQGREQIITGTGNVFADVGLPDPDERLLKARLAALVGETIAALGLTQTEAVEQLRIAQPDVSNLLRGRLRGFSLERLLEFAGILGNDLEITIRRAQSERQERRRGHVRLLVE
jgi:predicted XRE-type DNA-binding protein